MVKHGIKFDKAWTFDAAVLARLPAVTIQPTLEYDAKTHKLSDPLLGSVVEAAGVGAGAPVMLAMRALDGYTVAVSLADARRYRIILATTLDGVPMSIGGLGPLGCLRRRPVGGLQGQAAQGALCAVPMGSVLHRGEEHLSSPTD